MLYEKSILELRKSLLSKECSVASLIKDTRARILETNEELNSFISVGDEELQESIAQAQATLDSRGEDAPLLTGIPVAIKDSIATTDYYTTCASKMLAQYRSPFDATAVARLRNQGAIVVGKTNLDEFAMGSSTEFSIFGATKNPWDLERVAGGTSGGSAAAVSAAQVPLSLGSDTGGSIRQPAAFCGVYGIKPTYGRVSRYGLVAHASSFDQIGTLGRTLEDVAVGLQAIAGSDPSDATSSKEQVPDYLAELDRFTNGLRGIRIGLPKEYFGDGIQDEVRSSIEQLRDYFSQQGATVVDVSLRHTKYALATYYIITPAEASSNLSRYDGIHYGYRSKDAATIHDVYSKSRSEALGPEAKRRILIGTFVLSTGYYDAYYRKAQQVRTLLIDDFRAAFANDCDVLLTPTTPTTAFKIGEKSRDPLEMYRADIFTVPASIAGLPALSFPCGHDSAGLPIGAQLIGAPFSESTLLALAKHYSNSFAAETPSRWLQKNY